MSDPDPDPDHNIMTCVCHELMNHFHLSASLHTSKLQRVSEGSDSSVEVEKTRFKTSNPIDEDGVSTFSGKIIIS